MNPFFLGWRSDRRRSTSLPPHPPGRSTTWLVLLELGWLARQVARPSRSLPALAVGVTTAALLAPVTPGPVLDVAARTGVAAAGTVVAAVVVHVLLQRSGPLDDPEVRGQTTVLVGAAAAGLLLGATVVLTHLLAVLTPDRAQEGRLVGGGLAVDRGIAVVALLLIGGVLVTGLGGRLRVPGALALLGLGMLVGSDGLGWVLVDDPVQVQAVAVVALVVILFEGGLTTRLRDLRGAVGPGMLLATVGVAITAGVVAVVAVVGLGLDLGLALLLAAVVSSTDAAAVFEVLRRVPLGRRLAGTLQVESGANDPVAVMLTIGLLSSSELGGSVGGWVAFGVAQLGLGAGLGLAVGLAGAWVLGRVALRSGSLLPVLALAVGGAAYGLTALAGGSGFLAVYVCGITVAARTPGARRSLRSFAEGLATAVEVGLFLLLGLLVFPSTLPAVAWTGIAITLALLLVARPLAVLCSLGPLGLDRRELAAVSWLGMRGAVPIVLATVTVSAGYAQSGVVLDVVFVVVLVSTLVQGTLAPTVVRRLGLARAPTVTQLVMDATPFEGTDGQLFELRLARDSELVGATLAAAPPPTGVLVTAIVRGERIIVPRGRTRLAADDVLVVVSERTASTAALRGWAGRCTPRSLVRRDRARDGR